MAAVASSRWMLHTGGGRGDPPHNVKRFEFLEKHYINVMNYYNNNNNYYYYYLLKLVDQTFETEETRDKWLTTV